MGRLAKPEEIAGAVLSAAVPDASFTHGANIESPAAAGRGRRSEPPHLEVEARERRQDQPAALVERHGPIDHGRADRRHEALPIEDVRETHEEQQDAEVRQSIDKIPRRRTTALRSSFRSSRVCGTNRFSFGNFEA